MSTERKQDVFTEMFLALIFQWKFLGRILLCIIFPGLLNGMVCAYVS